MDTMWDENDAGDTAPRRREPGVKRQDRLVDLATLDDGRCHATTWGPAKRPPAKPTYENHFGPGGYNRCIGGEGHANPLHKDEWGHVFTTDVNGDYVTTVRNETPADRPTPESETVDA